MVLSRQRASAVTESLIHAELAPTQGCSWPNNITQNNIAWPCELGFARPRKNETTVLCDPLTMPPELTKAHQALDRSVDPLYRKKPFGSDTERLELLFERNRVVAEQPARPLGQYTIWCFQDGGR